MGDEATKTKTTKPTGRTINFNLVGDDLHLYETVRDIYQDEADEGESKVNDALEGLALEVRALVQAKFAPKAGRKELSHRQVFVRALEAALAAEDAATDAAENDAATEE